MTVEQGLGKKKLEQKKNQRLKRLFSVDLCACGVSNKTQCEGVCRKVHTNPKTGDVECCVCYQLERHNAKQGGSHRAKRTWKYGNQKDGSDKRPNKDARREKRERDRSQ